MAVSANLKILLVALLATQVVSHVVLANPTAKQYRRETSQRLPQTSIQTSTTPCQNAGFSGKCCNLTENSCYSIVSNCYCDLSCYLYGDCCEDINNIGCSPPSQTACPDLLPPTNGIINYSPFTNPKRPGTIAHFSCNANENFVLVGNSIRVCQHDLTWGGSEPECRKTCDELQSLANGNIIYEPQNPSSRKPIRTVATYSCNVGYTLSGAVKRVCQQSGDSQEWSGLEPTCIVNSCQLQFPDTGGCCESQSAFGCSVGLLFDSCSCSSSCFTSPSPFVKCCPDIGCPRRTCGEAGLSNGSCIWEGSEGCYVSDGDCYCDQECSNPMWNDCCADVNTLAVYPSSSSKAASQLYTGHESVRTKLYSRAHMASRPRGGPKVGKDQTTRELASELRSMSQAQELSDEERRAQWETILSELQEIQKTKKENK